MRSPVDQLNDPMRSLALSLAKDPLSSDDQVARFRASVMEWDEYNWAWALAHWLPWLPSGATSCRKVLTIGERSGGLSLWFASLGFQVTCTDYEPFPPTLKSGHRSWGVQDRIQYQHADVYKLPFDSESFDIVACKSVLGGLKLDYRDSRTRSLSNQKPAVFEMHRVTKPGGIFLGAENMRGSLVHQKLRERAWGKKVGWRHLSPPELPLLFQPYKVYDFRFYGLLGSRWRDVRKQRAAAYLDSLLSAWAPRSWNYITFIRARKAS